MFIRRPPPTSTKCLEISSGVPADICEVAGDWNLAAGAAAVVETVTDTRTAATV
jgi:hypothetical protein